MRFKITYEELMYRLSVFFIFAVNLSTAAASCAVGLMTAGILYHAFKTKQLPKIDRNIGYLFLIYFILQIIIAALSIFPQMSFREVVGEIHRCFPLFFAMLFLKTQRHLKGVLIAFILSVFINNICGAVQYFILHFDRAYAFAHTPTFYASFLLMQIPLLIWITTLKFMPTWTKNFSAFLTIFSVLMLILSVTRGAWLAFIIVCITLIVIDSQRRQKAVKYFVTGLALSLIVIVISPTLQARAVTLWNPHFTSNSERLLMWQSSLDMIKDFPIHGVGQKVFQLAYNFKYISPLAQERPPDGILEKGHSHPHNNILCVTSEGGLIGLIAFVMLHGYFFKRLYSLYKIESDKMILSSGLIGFLILLGLQLEGLTDTNMNQVPIMREYWFLIGMLLISGKIINSNKSI